MIHLFHFLVGQSLSQVHLIRLNQFSIQKLMKFLTLFTFLHNFTIPDCLISIFKFTLCLIQNLFYQICLHSFTHHFMSHHQHFQTANAILFRFLSHNLSSPRYHSQTSCNLLNNNLISQVRLHPLSHQSFQSFLIG